MMQKKENVFLNYILAFIKSIKIHLIQNQFQQSKRQKR